MEKSIARKILEARADARLNEYYYRRRSRNADMIDRGLRMFIAVMTGSTLAAVATSFGGEKLWQVLAAVATVAAGISPFLRHADYAGLWKVLAVRWTKVAHQIEQIDHVDIPDSEKMIRLRGVLAVAAELQSEDIIPRADGLAKRIYQTVCLEMRDEFNATA